MSSRRRHRRRRSFQRQAAQGHNHEPQPQEQSPLQTIFHVWADGSFKEKGKSMGGGIVIHKTQSKKFVESRDSQILIKALHLGHDKPGSSLVAELETCAAALKTIPSNALVILHNDCREVFNAIDKGTKGHKKSLLSKSFRNLFNQVSRMKDVTALWTHEKDDNNIKICHNLAQLGTFTTDHKATLCGTTIQFSDASNKKKRKTMYRKAKKSTPAFKPTLKH